MLQSLSKQDFLLEVSHTYVYSNSVQKQHYCFKQNLCSVDIYCTEFWLNLAKSFEGKTQSLRQRTEKHTLHLIE